MSEIVQVLMCHNPRHLVSLTLNHLDAILGYVTAAPVRVTPTLSPPTQSYPSQTSICSIIGLWHCPQANVELAFQHTVNNYASMDIAELQSVR